MASPTLAVAQAAEPTPAEIRAAAEAFDRGREAYKNEQYQEAAEQFERADASAPSTTALELAMRSRDKAKNPDRAATLAALALIRHPDDEALTNLAGEILRKYRVKLYELNVVCSEPCDLTSDSKIVHGARQSDRTIYLLPGPHTIVAGFGKGRTASQAADAQAGQIGELRFEPPVEETEPTPVAAAPSVAADPPPPELDEPPEPRASGGGLSPAIFWTGAAITAAAGGFTIWSGVDTINNPGADYVRDLCAQEGSDGVNCQAAYNEGRDKQLRTNIAIGATAALGVATILIGALATDWSGGGDRTGQRSQKPRSAQVTVRVSPWLGVDNGGLGAIGRF